MVSASCDSCGSGIRKWGGYLVTKRRATGPDPVMGSFEFSTIVGGDDLLCSGCARKTTGASRLRAILWWWRNRQGPGSSLLNKYK